MTIKRKRSHTASAVPNTQEIVEAEIVINTVDLKIHSRDDDDNVVLLSGLYDGVDLPRSDPHLDYAFWNDNGVLKVSAG